MSLDWDTTRIEDRPTKFPPDENGKMNDNLHVLIWLTMPIGIYDFTEKNIDEVWRRIDIWQNVIGSGFTMTATNADTGEVDVAPYQVPKEAVYNAVGLRTNAMSKTRPQFLKDLWEAHERVYEPQGRGVRADD